MFSFEDSLGIMRDSVALWIHRKVITFHLVVQMKSNNGFTIATLPGNKGNGGSASLSLGC
jgi:hypothetical protein